jgi:hypothetical protein
MVCVQSLIVPKLDIFESGILLLHELPNYLILWLLMPIFSKSFKKSEELKFTELFRRGSQK